MRLAPALVLSSLVLAATAPTAAAQDFNLDIGPAGSTLAPPTYAAAGLAGVWNAVSLPHTTPSTSPQALDEDLVDIHGNPTGVGVHQFGGQAWIDDVDASLPALDDALLGDALITNSLSLDSCLYLNGLANGTYEVLTYTWYPNHPEVISKTLFDFTAGTQFAGGTWGGAHAEGITYTRTIVNVTNGYMGPHAGLAPGGNTVLGGPICGMQLRLLECHESNYCTSTPNSTGSAATISVAGGCSAATGAVQLTAGPVPDQPGLFFFSDTPAGGGFGVPFGNGWRCVGGGTTIYRLPVSFASGGELTHEVDFDTAPAQGVLTPGSAMYFQAWYRDPAGGGAGFDLSDGIQLTLH